MSIDRSVQASCVNTGADKGAVLAPNWPRISKRADERREERERERERGGGKKEADIVNPRIIRDVYSSQGQRKLIARQTHFFFTIHRNQLKYLGNAAWREIRAINGGRREERSIVGGSRRSATEPAVHQTRRENKGGGNCNLSTTLLATSGVGDRSRVWRLFGEGKKRLQEPWFFLPLSVSRCNNVLGYSRLRVNVTRARCVVFFLLFKLEEKLEETF